MGTHFNVFSLISPRCHQDIFHFQISEESFSRSELKIRHAATLDIGLVASGYPGWSLTHISLKGGWYLFELPRLYGSAKCVPLASS